MTYELEKMEHINNKENFFTDLFSQLKRYDVLNGLFVLAYRKDDLKNIYQNTNNAMGILIQGLQDFGLLIGLAAQDKSKTMEEFSNIGFFISAIGNLIEALNILRSDIDHVLKHSEKTA